MASFRRQQKRTYYVQVDQRVLILEVYIDPNATIEVEAMQETNTRRGSCEWFKAIHLLELVSSVKSIATTRVYPPKPVITSMKYEYLANSWNIITQNLKLQCYFKKRSVEQFILVKKDRNDHLNGKTRNMENNNYDSLPTFHETLVAIVKQNVTEKRQLIKETTEDKGKVVKNDTSSNYFAEPTGNLITSAVKRKKTSLKKMAKKAKIASLKSQSTADSSETNSTQEQSDGSKDCLNTQIPSTSDYSTQNNSDDPKIEKTFIDLEEIPKGLNVSKVQDLRSDHLKFLINNMEEYLRTIFRGQAYCRRHEDYKKGGKSRDDLNFQVGMAHFTEDQHDCIMDALTAMFCYKHTRYIDYVSKVMFPEALIKLYQDVHQTKYEQAEERLLNDTLLAE